MNVEPASEAAKDAVWAEYEGLDEKHKRAITRHIAKANPGLFRFWVKAANMGQGLDQRKVVAREASYGPRLDRTLKEWRAGELAADVFAAFLVDTGILDPILGNSPGGLKGEDLARVVDQGAAESPSVFGKLAVAFVKCYPPPREGGAVSAPEAADVEMTALVDQLEVHATKLDAWAASLRVAQSVPPDDVAATVEAANRDASRLTELMSGHRQTTGCVPRDIKTPEDLAEHLRELSKALVERADSGRIAEFLGSLAEAIRLLNVAHRSAAERVRLSTMRDTAAAEIAGVVDSGRPTWTAEADVTGREWLRRAFALGDGELEETQVRLKNDGYPVLSEFIAVGDAAWMPDESVSNGGGSETLPLKATAEAEGPRAVVPGREPDGAGGQQNLASSSEPVAASAAQEQDAGETVEGPVSAVEPNTPMALVDSAIVVHIAEGSVIGLTPAADLAGGRPELGGAGAEAEADGEPKTDDPEHQSTRQSIRAVSGPWETVPVEAVRLLAAKLARDGNHALAYHLLLNAASLDELRACIPPWVFGAVVCGSAMQATDQSAITVLQGFFQQYDPDRLNELEGSDRVAVQLLLAAGALEPALFFPITGAASTLQTLHLPKMPSLQALAAGVAEYGARGVGLPRADLFSTISADDLKRKLEAIRERARDWLLDRAPQFDIISRPGKDTWRTWISKSGPIGRLLGPVVAAQVGAVSDLRTLAEKYADGAEVDQEARHLYRNGLSHRGELLMPALHMIRRHTAEAIEIANEWISVVESQPDARQGYDQKVLAKLRRCFGDHAQQARLELTAMSGSGCPPAVSAGAQACLRVVDDLSRVLDGSGTDSAGSASRSAQRLLNDDLLRITKLRLTESGVPRLPDYSTAFEPDEGARLLALDVVRSIGAAAEEGLPSLLGALKTRSEMGDHEGTKEILELLEGVETPDVLKRLEHERLQSISRHRETAQRRLKLGQRALSDSLTKGLYAPREYERWAVRLESAERDMRSPGFLRFADVLAVCSRLSDELANRKTTEIARLAKEIDGVNPSPEQRRRVEAVLAAGDAHTATDYLDRIRDQSGLPDLQEADAATFMRFFGKEDRSACSLIEAELRDASSTVALVDRIAKRAPVPGLDLAEMPSAQVREAAEFLRLWFDARRLGSLSESIGTSIFTFFGMRPRKLVKATERGTLRTRGDVWDLQIEPLESRDVCPTALFGSNAQGHYKVMGYWRQPAVEDILQHARELGRGPVIVLYFGRMTVSERRSLAAEQARGDVIVIDDVLAVFLAGERRGRLLSLFLCSLPFAHVSPYTKAASLLPPEMFYGRHREIRQLTSAGTDSSCLLYGGRQIGKTVLLRHVQRLFERQASGNVATYIDLKGKEIGTNRAMDEVWLVIAEELAKRKVITEPVGRQVKHDWLFAQIEAWLSSDDKRRLLVLLDEADDFLAADGMGQNSRSPFSACTVLKDLMERTNRRFKLVFAGLHNVQKSTKVSNNPLAHFGEPICIGAMTAAGESREAEALITEPLEAAGYFFESADLPARILAQTNYYPNLIQIYCDVLLKYMQQRTRVLFAADKTPPYNINAKMLEDAYEEHELREELRLRFKWTLELDRRFEVIANILALNDVDCTRGLDVSEIAQNAQVYWGKGFAGKDGTPLTYEGFRDLLEEMVGLGILRRAEPPDHFALRNPNVLNLIGSRSVVEKLLEDAHRWDRADEYDAQKFRGQISEVDKTLRSPLNAAQEAKFRSGSSPVSVVCGCLAGQVDKVADAITYRFGRDGYVRVLTGHEDLAEFRNELSSLSNRKSQGTTLIVVPDHVRWDRNWIVEAMKRVPRFERSKGVVGVILVAGSAHTWSLVPDLSTKRIEGADLVSIGPWDDSTTNQWLQEEGYTAVDAACRASLAEVTGNWPVLLEAAAKELRNTSHDAEALKQKVREVIFTPERKRDLYAMFGLADAVIGPLRFLGEEGAGWSPEEIGGLLGDGDASVSIEHVGNVLRWAELMGLARRGPKGWELEPGVRQVLSLG